MPAPEVICVPILGSCQPSASMGVLVIDDVVMLCPAWTIVNLTPLWLTATRGRNARIPGAVGARAYPRRIEETEYSLTMWLSGACDDSGTPFGTTKLDGLYQNVAFLRDFVLDPPPAPQATKPASLWAPDGTTELIADVQVIDFRWNGNPVEELFPAVLDLRIPTGGFAEVGS